MERASQKLDASYHPGPEGGEMGVGGGRCTFSPCTRQQCHYPLLSVSPQTLVRETSGQVEIMSWGLILGV